MGVELNIDLRLRLAVLVINFVTSRTVGTGGFSSGIQISFLVLVTVLSSSDVHTIPRMPRCVKPKNPVDPCSPLSIAISVPY
jgi:hypothetical protein